MGKNYVPEVPVVSALHDLTNGIRITQMNLMHGLYSGILKTLFLVTTGMFIEYDIVFESS